ncbi:MAG: zinc dependent phospholipase C family protein [Desulfobacteraceae bacterium]|jgi:hypothetical protein
MFLLKILFFLMVSLIYQLILTEGAWAWGPAIHTVIGCTILDELSHIFPPVARVIQLFPMEYLYGSLSADFFVGKGQKHKDGHSHNWDTGFRFFEGAGDDREAAYAYGFLSHLAADVVAHNYYVPKLIHSVSAWKRMGHIYVEAKADQYVGPVYTRIARDLLSREELGCDELLRSAVRTSRNGLKTRKHLFTQSVRLSDFLNCSQPTGLVSKGSRYQISPEYLNFMINLAYRLVRDFLTNTESSPCLSYDPIGSRNLRLAARNGIFSKLFHIPQPMHLFNVDQELLKL